MDKINLKDYVEILWRKDRKKFVELLESNHFSLRDIPQNPVTYSPGKHLEMARIFQKRMDLVQASENLWGAINLAVRSLLGELGIYTNNHKSVIQLGKEMAEYTWNEQAVHTALSVGQRLHRCFYENNFNSIQVERFSRQIAYGVKMLSDADLQELRNDYTNVPIHRLGSGWEVSGGTKTIGDKTFVITKKFIMTSQYSQGGDAVNQNVYVNQAATPQSNKWNNQNQVYFNQAATSQIKWNSKNQCYVNQAATPQSNKWNNQNQAFVERGPTTQCASASNIQSFKPIWQRFTPPLKVEAKLLPTMEVIAKSGPSMIEETISSYEDLDFFIENLLDIIISQQTHGWFYLRYRFAEVIRQCVEKATDRVLELASKISKVPGVLSEEDNICLKEKKDDVALKYEQLAEAATKYNLKDGGKEGRTCNNDEQAIECEIEKYLEIAAAEVERNPYKCEQMCVKAFSMAVRVKLAKIGMCILSNETMPVIIFILATQPRTCRTSWFINEMYKAADIMVSGFGANCLHFSMEDGLRSVQLVIRHLRNTDAKVLRERIINELGPTTTGNHMFKIDATMEILTTVYPIDLVVV